MAHSWVVGRYIDFGGHYIPNTAYQMREADEHMVIDGKIGVAAINPHYCGYCGAKMDDAEVQI